MYDIAACLVTMNLIIFSTNKTFHSLLQSSHCCSHSKKAPLIVIWMISLLRSLAKTRSLANSLNIIPKTCHQLTLLYISYPCFIFLYAFSVLNIALYSHLFLFVDYLPPSLEYTLLRTKDFLYFSCYIVFPKIISILSLNPLKPMPK